MCGRSTAKDVLYGRENTFRKALDMHKITFFHDGFKLCLCPVNDSKSLLRRLRRAAERMRNPEEDPDITKLYRATCVGSYSISTPVKMNRRFAILVVVLVLLAAQEIQVNSKVCLVSSMHRK